jgi:MOSC domain-containing protein YiiM
VFFVESQGGLAARNIKKGSRRMKLLSVNVSPPAEVLHGDKIVTTGIFKEPVNGRVMLRTLNLDGDGQADLIGHGGIYKAAYAYSVENYDNWKRELGGTDFAFGQFGENFTVEGMTEDEIHVGDVFRVGDALVEVTQPRVPCYKLGIKMGLSRFEKKFLANCRVGFYLRVLQEGEVGAGDSIDRLKTDPERMTVREICHLLYFDSGNLEGARKALRIHALSPGWRQSFEERVTKTTASIQSREDGSSSPVMSARSWRTARTVSQEHQLRRRHLTWPEEVIGSRTHPSSSPPD